MKYLVLILLSGLAACGSRPVENAPPPAPPSTPVQTAAKMAATPALPNLQSEILDDRNKTTSSPIGKFDFKNFTYELPRGWQNPDGSTEITLTNGHLDPVEGKTNRDDMSDEEKAAARLARRIGMTYVTTKYLELTGDGEDEAVVILKIETGGSALPQIGYIYTWKNNAPELLYPFRTGDRADGGLKDLRSENGMLVVELYGQDRFLLGGFETGKVTGDEEQLCCPAYFTRTNYKWNGNTFLMQGKRLTYSLANPSLPPEENLGDRLNDPNYKPKK
jgi:hypothetical protein